MDKLRMRFIKTDRAVYISHLDLMHTLQRSFSRAGYRLKYSEGFNPHPQISIALPLSVGTSSVCEILDFKLEGDADLKALPERMNKALPEGIRAIEAYEQVRKVAEIKWLRIEGVFEYDNADTVQMAEELKKFFASDELIITKKTKRGVGESDIRPSIRSIEFTPCEGCVAVNAVISAQEPTLNPDLLANSLEQLKKELVPDFARFRRIETYDADMNIYR